MSQIIYTNKLKNFPAEKPAGNLRDIGNLYDEYAPALLGIIEAKIVNKGKSIEVLQLLFQEIGNKIDEYDSQKIRLFTWLYQLTCITLSAYNKMTAATIIKAAAVKINIGLPADMQTNHISSYAV